MADPLPHEPVSYQRVWRDGPGMVWRTTSRELAEDILDDAHLDIARVIAHYEVRLAHMQQLIIVKPRRKG